MTESVPLARALEVCFTRVSDKGRVRGGGWRKLIRGVADDGKRASSALEFLLYLRKQ